VLAMRGLAPEDLDFVVMSHLHTDHVGGLREVESAKKVLVNDVEWECAHDRANHLVYDEKFWSGIDVETYHMRDSGIGPVGKSFDLFGDGTVELVNLPGHTPGLAGALVRNNGKNLLLAGDCGFNRDSWGKSLLPTICPDREGMSKSFAWIRELAAQPETLDCITAHETELPKREFTL